MNQSSGVRRLSSLKKGLFIVTGTTFLGLGMVGIILPVLPTTPFLLLSAACYLRGSERMYRWLLNNKWFGTYIRNYREGKGIPLRGKVSALLVLWITIFVSAILLVKISIVQIILFAIAIGVSTYIIRLPTLRARSAVIELNNEELDQKEHPRIRREKRTMDAMIQLYCRGEHDAKNRLCEECTELLEYAYKRLDQCPFQEKKSTCAKCPIHCYEPRLREKAKKAMRYSGPKMLWHHPIMAVQHLLDGRKKPIKPSKKPQK